MALRRDLFTHLLVLMISIGGASTCAYLLYNDINYSRSIFAGLEIAGELIDKAQTVKRKLGEEMIWNLVNLNDKLYWNDSIQTAEKAHAEISLKSGGKITLGEQSLVVLERNNDSLSLKLKQGQLLVASEEGSENKIKINGLDLPQDGNQVSLQMDEANNQIIATTSGKNSKKIIIDKDGKINESELPVLLLSPEPLSNLYKDKSDSKVEFIWRNKTKGAVSIEIASDKEFKKIILSQVNQKEKYEVKLSPGLYYWRIKLSDATLKYVSEARSLTVVDTKAPTLKIENIKKHVSFRSDIPTIDFDWTPAEGISKYVFEISSNKEFTDVYFKDETANTYYRTSKFKEGLSYWRVSSVYGGNHYKSTSPMTISFDRLKEMPPPELQFPEQDYKYTFDFYQKANGLSFRWNVKQPETYRFVFSRSEKLKDEVIAFETTKNETLLQEAYPTGVYYWAVGHKDLDGQWKYSDIRKLEVGPLIPLLSPPKILGPLESAHIDLLKTPSVKWSWQPVEGAKLYKFKLYKVGEKEELLLDDSLKEVTNEKKDLPDGKYRWLVSSVDEFGRESKTTEKYFTVSHGHTLDATSFDMSEVQ